MLHFSRARRFVMMAVAVVAVAALPGCTSVVSGSASRAAGSVTVDGVDVDTLSTGNYPTAPLPPYGTAGSPEVGVYLEGTRLAAHAVLLTDIDPALNDGPPLVAGVLANTEALELVIRTFPDGTPNEIAAAAARHNFLLAFATQRFSTEGEGDRISLTNAVMVFPDAAAAKAAATEMAAVDSTEWPEMPSEPTTIAEYPDAIVFSTSDTGEQWLSSYTPHGRYLLYQHAGAPTFEAARDLVVATLNAQGPLIDAFEPTPPAEWAELPIDPTGLLARTIPVPSADARVDENIVYPPAAALHYQSDPARSSTLFDEVGVVAVAAAKATVYQTSQDDGGAHVVDAFSAEAVDSMGFSPTGGVLGMPNVRCFSQEFAISSGETSTMYYCIGAAGRYAFEATAWQPDDLHQIMAAQYLMLTAQ